MTRPGAGWRTGPVLGIESSCDECSAAVLDGDRLLGHVIATQDAHAAFGGVVPEIAARAHLRQMDAVVAASLDRAGLGVSELAGVGVTAGPGLVGSLLVGVNWAKAFAFGRGLPLVGIHHMEAHLFANSIEDPSAGPPFVGLLVSGGHTLLVFAREWGRYELLGETRDDAAGEAFDKVARRLGLGWPGGPAIEREAASGTAGRFDLPRPMLDPGQDASDSSYLDFSFSRLKTAVALLAADLEEGGGPGALAAAVPDLAAEFQAAALDVLVHKTLRAVQITGCRRVLLGGGVARNGVLAERMRTALGTAGELFVPSPRLATDNGAMVARVAAWRLSRGERSGLGLNADPSLAFPGLTRTPGAHRAGAGSRRDARRSPVADTAPTR